MASVQQTLQRAVGFHRGGDLAEAERLYRQVIRVDPNHADACNLLGISCHQRNMGPEAVRYLTRAVSLNRRAASYHCNLGMAYRGVGDLDKAVDCYRNALRLQPVYPEAQFNLGIALQQQNQHAAAEDCFRLALKHLPSNADVLLNLGNALQEQQRFDEARACFEQILDAISTHFEARFNLANCYKEQRQYLFASDHFRRAAELNPKNALVHFHLANMLQLQERNDEAIASYHRALAIDPHYVEAHNNLGGAWHRQRELDQAVAAFRQAIQLKPGYAEAHNNLGRSLFFQGNSPEALDCIHRALQLEPELADAYLTLGEIHSAARQTEHACRAFERAVQIDPEGAEGWRRLGNIYRLEHRLDEARTALRRAVGEQIEGPLPRLWLESLCPAVFDDVPAIETYRERLASSLERIAGMRPRPTFEEIALYGSVPTPSLQFHNDNNRPLLEAFARIYRGCVPAETPQKGSGKPKIGFVVTGGHEGIFQRFIGGVTEKLNVDLFEPVIICSPAGAATLKRLRTSDHVELLTVPFRHDLLIDRVQSARFDVLYHFEVGTDLSNYFFPFYRLAPVQCTSGGIAQTSGLEEVDYFLSSDMQEPDDADAHYTEQLIRTRGLPSYQPRIERPAAPRTREQFGLRGDQTLYVCPQKLRKIHPDFDPLLRAILHRDPRGVVVLVEETSHQVTDHLRRRLARSMPDVVDRVHFVPRLSIPDYLSLTAAADVLLDPLHYGSGVTMYDALSFDKPVVTLPGRFVRGRYALGFYRQMGIDDCIAVSPDDYVNKAVALGTDRDYRRDVERKLAEATPMLFDDAGVVTEYERVFMQLVEESRSR